MFAAPAPPTGPTLAEDTPCRRCGYNLRSLPESGNCPECATPVALSLRGDLLKHADPAWVRDLARGASLIMYAIAGFLIALILAVACAMLGFSIDVLVMIVAPAAGIAILAGQWLLTRPDPSANREDARTTGRLVVRWLLVAALVISGFEQIASLAGSFMSHPGVKFVMGIITEALFAAWVIAYSRHLAWLCDRIPDAKRAQAGRRIGPILVILAIASLLKQFIPGVGPAGAAPGGKAPWLILVGILFAILNVALLVYAIRALSLNSRIAKLLRVEARNAEASWSVTPK